MWRLNRGAETIASVALLVAALALYGVAFFPRSLTDLGPISIATSYDFHSFFLPKFVFGTEEILRGRLPIWNPFEYGGIPFLATAQPAVFYPPKFVAFALFQPVVAYWIFLFGHYALLGAGFVLLLRRQKLTGAAVFVGAAYWMFASTVIASNYHPTRIANLSWTPFVYILVDRIGAGERTRVSAALLALVVGVQLCAGYPEFPIDLAILVAVHAIVRGATREWSRPFKSFGIVACGYALALLLAAVQLLPLAEAGLVARRERVAAGYDWRTAFGAAPPGWLPTIAYFPGLTPFAFAALFDRRCRAAAAGFVFCALMGAGDWELLRALPGFSMLRFPWTWLFLGPFFLAWLGAIGCDSVLSRRGETTRLARAQRAVLLLLLVAWALFCALQLVLLLHGRSMVGEGWRMLATRAVTPSAAALGALGALGVIVASFRFVPRRAAPWTLLGAATLVTVGHLAATPFSAPSAPVKRPYTFGRIKSLVGSMPPNSGRTFSLEDVLYGYTLTDRVENVFGAEDSFEPWRYRRITETLRFLPPFLHVEWGDLIPAAGFLDAMDLQYLVGPADLLPHLTRYGFSVIRAGESDVLVENPNRMGRAWVSHRARRFRAPEAARRFVMSRRFDPRKVTAVESELSRKYAAEPDKAVSYPSAIRRLSATVTEVDVNLAAPGILVLSESTYPGWQAWLDGNPAEWFPANYLLRGIEVGSGRHTVRFEYRPWSVRIGSWISLASLFVVFGLLLVAPVRRVLARARA